MRIVSKKSRQLSASSPASTRASRGARVCANWRGGRRDCDRGELSIYKERDNIAYYAGAPGGSHLKDMWHACNLLKVVPCSHARLDCRVVVPASPGFRQ